MGIGWIFMFIFGCYLGMGLPAAKRVLPLLGPISMCSPGFRQMLIGFVAEQKMNGFEVQHATLNGITPLEWLIGSIVVGIFLRFVLPRLMSKTFDRLQTGRQSKELNFMEIFGLAKHMRAAKGLGTYKTTALKLGALISCENKKMDDVAVFIALRRMFDIDEDDNDAAMAVFHHQLTEPSRSAALIQPFTAVFGQSNAMAETMLTGVCAAALADSGVTTREIGILKVMGGQLGLDGADLQRVLLAAGIDPRSKAQREQDATLPADEEARRAALAPLGLSRKAGDADIAKAKTRIAAHFAQDVLEHEEFPASEREKAEAQLALYQSLAAEAAAVKQDA